MAKTGSTNTQWFLDRINAQDLDQKRVAAAMRLDPSSFFRLIIGERKLKLEEAPVLASILGATLEEVLVAAGVKLKVVDPKNSIEVSGWIDGEFSIHWEIPKGPKSAPLPSNMGKNVRVLRYQTLGSPAESMDGGLVYYLDSKQGTKGVGECIGRLSVIQIKGSKGTARLGVLKRGYGAGRHVILDMAGRVVEEDAQIESASPVVWMKL